MWHSKTLTGYPGNTTWLPNKNPFLLVNQTLVQTANLHKVSIKNSYTMKPLVKTVIPKPFVLSALTLLCILDSVMGQTPIWTEKDRQYLLENLIRTRDELVLETENLTPEQWSFKANDSTWSIAQVVEHLGIYERTSMYEGRIILLTAPEPELVAYAKTDSEYLAWMNEPKPHKADNIHTPLGLWPGKHNLIWFLHGRNNIIDFIRTTPDDLKAHYTYRGGAEKRRSLHGLFVVHYGHTDRHLRQIRRSKQMDDYPRKGR